MINKKVLLKIALVFFIFNMFYFISYASHADKTISSSPSSVTVKANNSSTVTVKYKDTFSMEFVTGATLNISKPSIVECETISTSSPSMGSIEWKLKITGKSKGSGTITVKYGGVTATIKVNVTDKNGKTSDSDSGSGSGGSSKLTSETITDSIDSTSWITDAFSATRNFFSDEVTDDLGFVEPWMVVFSDIVRAINRVLIILLAGLSIISLTIVGIKYIMSPYQASRKEEAKKSLHTVFSGMVYGFGAFAIWKIVMSIVKVVIGSF